VIKNFSELIVLICEQVIAQYNRIEQPGQTMCDPIEEFELVCHNLDQIILFFDHDDLLHVQLVECRW
jgi:hypothetical protein